MPSHLPARSTAHQREERRIRIMAQVRAGFSYEAIARDESLTRERIRQIVSQSLKSDVGADRDDHNRVQIARLEPALRLAAHGIENGKLQAIGHLLKVLERLDKYGSVVRQSHVDRQGARERLLRKLNCLPARGNRPREAASGELEGPENLPKDESGSPGL